jgi:hypothetical protein
MKRIAKILPLTIAILSATAATGSLARAQEDPTLDAKRRLYPEIGEGFRGIRRAPDGSYYVLRGAAPAAPPKVSKRSKVPPPAMPAVLVFDSKGTKLREIHIQGRPRERVSPDSFDLDATGRVYIADPSANAVNIYAADGTLSVRLNIPAPTQIVALPRDEFAVSSANAGHLISVFDLQGKPLREFGELADLSDDAELNHRLNAGHLAKDNAGILYFAFRYLPEPTVRKYDSASGSLVDELSLTTLDLQPMAQSARQEIARAAAGKPVRAHEIISGFGLDPQTQEFWLALGNLLMHFDNADNRVTTSRTYTTDGARMVPNFILVEKDRLLLGGDPLGIYEFLRSSAANSSH